MSAAPRILLLGAGGQLGQALAESFTGAGQIQAHTHATLDLADQSALRAAVRAFAPTVILNAAAYTAVDRAESEPEKAYAINATAPGILAEEAARASALLVHYSTDYVYDGQKSGPWSEDDATNPLNVYGASKLAGEVAITAACSAHLIFRTSWVFGPTGANFVRTMLRLGRERAESSSPLNIVDDQLGAPTSTIELADATRTIVDGILAGQFSNFAGIYHMTCAGSVSWCGFARAIFARAAQSGFNTPNIHPILTSAYPTPARRPANSVMSNEKLASHFGIALAPWQSALDAVLTRLAL